jgi:hypothetical protein
MLYCICSLLVRGGMWAGVRLLRVDEGGRLVTIYNFDSLCLQDEGVL